MGIESVDGGRLERRTQVVSDFLVRRLRNKIYERSVNSVDNVSPFEAYVYEFTKQVNEIQLKLSSHNDELQEILTSSTVALEKDSNLEERESSACDRLAEFIRRNFTYEELEAMAREGKTMLNRLVEYVVKDDEIHIHIPITFLEEPVEGPKLFIEALQILAHKIIDDPLLRNIQRLRAVSWIIKRSPKLLEKKFGFTDIAVDDMKDEGSAIITREKLLTLYGGSR